MDFRFRFGFGLGCFLPGPCCWMVRNTECRSQLIWIVSRNIMGSGSDSDLYCKWEGKQQGKIQGNNDSSLEA